MIDTVVTERVYVYDFLKVIVLDMSHMNNKNANHPHEMCNKWRK